MSAAPATTPRSIADVFIELLPQVAA